MILDVIDRIFNGKRQCAIQDAERRIPNYNDTDGLLEILNTVAQEIKTNGVSWGYRPIATLHDRLMSNVRMLVDDIFGQGKIDIYPGIDIVRYAIYPPVSNDDIGVISWSYKVYSSMHDKLASDQIDIVENFSIQELLGTIYEQMVRPQLSLLGYTGDMVHNNYIVSEFFDNINHTYISAANGYNTSLLDVSLQQDVSQYKDSLIIRCCMRFGSNPYNFVYALDNFSAFKI